MAEGTAARGSRTPGNHGELPVSGECVGSGLAELRRRINATRWPEPLVTLAIICGGEHQSQI
jgi:hypothetical protein